MKKKRLVRGRDYHAWAVEQNYYGEKYYDPNMIFESREEARSYHYIWMPSKVVRIKHVVISDNGNPVR